MTIQNECVECIRSQSLRVADAIEADATLRRQIHDDVLAMSKHFDFTKTPPEVARPVYEHLAHLAGKTDLYDDIKRHSSAQARSFVPELKARIAEAEDPFFAAIKVAVAGNVIDLAAEVAFNLDDEIAQLFETPFAIDDTQELYCRWLTGASTLLYIADNAGEHLFDALAIETLQSLFPDLQVYYLTRGAPIINDITYDEAKADGLGKHCILIDSGVDTPGFVYARANDQARELFDSCDVVIAKGMGNYECLSPAPRSALAYLFKVKCQVVSRSVGAPLGGLVCKVH